MSKLKLVLVTLLFTIPALFLGRVLWPPAPELPTPSAMQLPLFALLYIIEGFLFGIGMTFIIFGWPLVKNFTEHSSVKSNKLSKLVFFSISWLLVSWWPHDNMHIHNGYSINGVLFIDYFFHLTVIIATLIISLGFIELMKKKY